MRRDNNKKSEKVIDGKDLKIGIAVAEFNWDITSKMLKGALDVLEKNRVKKDGVEIIKVPGSLEVPLACQKLVQKEKFDALIALGCVIQGDTDHHIHVGRESYRGTMDVMLKFSIPIGFGIITAHNFDQAKARSIRENNVGAEAAEAVLKVLNIK